MKKIIAILLLTPSIAFAGGWNSRDGNEQHQGQHQAQAQVQGQNQSSKNVNKSSANSHSNADSHSTSKSGAASKSGAYSNSGGNHLSADGGKSRSSSKSAGGNAAAAGGSGGLAQGGDVTVNTDYDSVAQAATVFAGQCQRGLSGAVDEGGFSILDTRQFCDYIELANINYQAYLRAQQRTCKKPVKPPCEAGCTRKEAWVKHNPPTCDTTPEAQHFLDLYHGNLADAQRLIDNTKTTGLIDRISSQVFKPIAIIAALVLLL